MTIPAPSVITGEMRAAVGVESEPYPVEVTTSHVRLFARAVGHTDPVYYDEDAARAAGYRNLPAPPGYLGTPIFDPTKCDPTFGAPRRGVRSFHVPYRRVLNGGTEIEYHDTICAGDRLMMSSRIASFDEKVGSLGPMLITVTETLYRDEAGKLVALMRGTMIQY